MLSLMSKSEDTSQGKVRDAKLVKELAKTIHKQIGGTNWQWKNQVGAGIPIAMKLSKIVLRRLSRLGALRKP